MSASLVPIARFINWSEAHMARGLLQANGIGAVLHDGNLVSVNWPLAMAIGGVKLMVPPHQAAEGRLLLKDVAAGEFIHDAEEQGSVPSGGDTAIERCPACRSEDVFRPKSFLSAVIGSVLMAPILWSTRKRVCRSCSHEWLAEAADDGANAGSRPPAVN